VTQEFLQDAIVKDLQGLFEGETLKNSAGVERQIRVYPQDVPIRAGSDVEPDQDLEENEQAEPEDVPEPYVIVRIPGGELPAQDERQKVEAVLVVCVYDADPNRQGFRDALHIVNAILTHYAKGDIVARRYQVQYPIKWVTQEEDTHPYYFAAMALTLNAPAIFKEVPET
jgi:hypothetical protein